MRTNNRTLPHFKIQSHKELKSAFFLENKLRTGFCHILLRDHALSWPAVCI
jgi:hypothetical protein